MLFNNVTEDLLRNLLDTNKYFLQSVYENIKQI